MILTPQEYYDFRYKELIDLMEFLGSSPEKEAIKRVASDSSKIYEQLYNNIGHEISFEGRGITSGEGNWYTLKNLEIEKDRVRIELEKRKKIYYKDLYEVLAGKEKFWIK